MRKNRKTFVFFVLFVERFMRGEGFGEIGLVELIVFVIDFLKFFLKFDSI